MDPFTHMALGACIGQAIGYKRFGGKALLFGAVAAGMPDLDVLWTPYLGEYASWKYHRHDNNDRQGQHIAALQFGNGRDV